MKIRNILALVALGFVLMFSSCKKEEKGGTPDHLKIIPANSAMVMTINAKELVEKGGLADYKDFEVYKKMHQELTRYEPEAAKIIDEFLKNTRSTGFNLDQIFAYSIFTGRYNSPQLIFTFGVEDAEKAAKWLTKLQETKGYDDEYELVKEDGYYYFRLDYSTLLIWDKTKALFLPISEYEEEEIPSIESLLRIDEEHSIISNADFMASYNTQKDFTFWMSFKKLIELNGDDAPELSTLSKLYGEEWENASMDFSINFTNEKAALSVSIWPMSFMEKFKKEYPVLKDSFEESLLRYFPKDFFFVMKSSFNIQEYYKIVVDKLGELAKELENQDEDEYDYYYYSPFKSHRYVSELLAMVDNEKIAKIVSSFKGDIVADIFGFQEGIVPKFGIAVTINGEEAFNNLLSLLPEEIAPAKTESYYTYVIPMVMTLYAGQNGDVMYITNVKDAIDSFFAQGYKENLSSSSVAAYMKNSPILYSLNVDINSYPTLATTLLRQSMGSMEYGIFSKFMEPFSSMNLMQTETNSGELNLMLKENKENSLKVLLKAIDSYATSMMGF